MLEAVALLTESVDRNDYAERTAAQKQVALLTESVDRNHVEHFIYESEVSRSPHGERG